MSVVDLRVELPTYALSFVIRVPESCTVFNVKCEISKACPGQPHVEGQKLIWRGRYLDDAETVQDIWKNPGEPRVVQLAVHPSQWSSEPPKLDPSPDRRRYTPSPLVPQYPPLEGPQPAPSFPSSTASLPRNADLHHPFSSPTTNTISPATHPLTYVATLHENAIRALTSRNKLRMADDFDCRSTAIQVLERNGWLWPPIFDEEFPEPTAGGIAYERLTIHGQIYLSLRKEIQGQEPTPLQAHALKVLTLTFTVLSMSLEPATLVASIPHNQFPIPPTVNVLLQEVGMAQLRLRNQNNQDRHHPLPGLRDIPVRPILAPLLMLLLRALVLLYFVAPVRKPIFGLLILAWMLFEIWQPMRHGLLHGLRRAEEERRQQDAAAGALRQQPNAGHQGAPFADQNPGNAQPRAAIPPLHAARVWGPQQMHTMIDTLASINMPMEEAIINRAPGAQTVEPGIVHKAATFLGLLFTTMHPAIWNRRRGLLQRREGAIRTEAGVRDARRNVEGGEATQVVDARPRWVSQYMDRVIAEEWVDDAD